MTSLPSTFLIQSRSNQSIGTGFCIDKDEKGSYLVTCAHVVEECGDDSLMVNNHTAKVIDIEDNSVIDLALLYVEGLTEVTTMELCEDMVDENVLFEVEGFKTHHVDSYKLENLTGNIKKISQLASNNQMVSLYELILDKENQITKGYSGSAIVLKGTNKVIAVATDKHANSHHHAYATPISYLKTIVREKVLLFSNCQNYITYKEDESKKSWIDIFSNNLLNTVGGVIVVGIVTSVIYDKFIKEPDVTPKVVVSEHNKTRQQSSKDTEKLANLIKDLDIYGNKEKFLKAFFGNDWQKALQNQQTYHNLKLKLDQHQGDMQKLIEEKEELEKKIASKGLKSSGVQKMIDKAFKELRFDDVLDLLDNFIENNKELEQDLINAHYQKALAYMEKIEYHKAKEEFEQIGSGIKDTDILNDYAIMYDELGEYNKAIEFHNKALTIRLDTLGDNHSSTATTYNNLGIAWSNKGDYDKAIEFYNKALTIYLDTLGDNHPSMANTYNNLGIAWRNKGEYDKAIEFYNKALTIKLDTLGDNHPSTANTYNNLGLVWGDKGDYDKAIEFYNKDLTITLAILGDNHPSTADTYNNLGLAWYSKGNYDKAIEFYNKALTIKLDTLGDNHPSTAETYNNLGLAWRNKGDYDKAIEFHNKALTIKLDTLGDNHPSTAETYNNLGVVWESKKEYNQAIEFCNKAYAIWKPTLRDNHPHTKMVKRNIEIIKAKLKNTPQ